MATHSSILAWRIPWIVEPGRLQSMGSQESDTTWRLNHHHHHKWTIWAFQSRRLGSRYVNWYSHCGEQYGGSIKKLKIELLYNSAV